MARPSVREFDRSAFVRRAGLGLGIGLALTTFGCRPKPRRDPPLCAYDVASDEEVDLQTLPPKTWLTLVSPSIDKKTMRRQGPLVDACGGVIKPPPPAPDCPDFDSGTPSGSAREPSGSAREVVETDLVLGQVGERRVLAWAATDELGDGEAVGTVSLLEWTSKGIEVYATGHLRGYRQGARLRLHQSGGKPVVILESDRCDAQRRCTRVATFAPIVTQRIAEIPLYETDGRCIGRTRFDLARSAEVALPGRWVRRFHMTRQVELEPEGIVLIDSITGEDYDADDPALPPRPFRRATARRPLELLERRFELRDEDLWTKVVADEGRVRAPTAGEASANGRPAVSDATSPTN